MIEAYLAFGSNIGNKINLIKTAYILLELSTNIHIEKKSHFYFSKAYKGEDLNDFVNSVIKIKTILTPNELLSRTQNIEKILGRKKNTSDKYENRTIDIDILFYGNQKISQKDLLIPHSDIENRDFVLIPLKEIAPKIILPSKKTIDEVTKSIENTTRIIYEKEY